MADNTLELALEEAKEGIEILDNMFDSVRKHGNYSKESTMLFISQARQCFIVLIDQADSIGKRGGL